MNAEKNLLLGADNLHVRGTFSDYENLYTAFVKLVKYERILFQISSKNRGYSKSLKTKDYIYKIKIKYSLTISLR